MRSEPARAAAVARRAAFAVAVALQLLVLYLPRAQVPGGMDVPGSDKALHVAVFALVMLTGVLAGLPARGLAVVLVAHAGISELVQHLLLPGRTGDLLDAVADLGGIALGWYLASMLDRHLAPAAARRAERR